MNDPSQGVYSYVRCRKWPYCPTRQSFGTRLIETPGRQLNGKVEITYDSKGFIYALDVPLSALKPFD